MTKSSTLRSTQPNRRFLTFDVDPVELIKEFPFLTELRPESLITFLDHTQSSQNGVLTGAGSSIRNLRCFWCHHPMTDEKTAIWCPISEYNDGSTNTYTSLINGNVYTIVDHINDTSKSTVYTDGTFCSAPCCLAFINEHKHNPLYTNSEYLLKRRFPDEVRPAPHWRLLTCYGGPLTIEEFRARSTNSSFQYEGPQTRPVYFSFKSQYHL